MAQRWKGALDFDDSTPQAAELAADREEQAKLAAKLRDTLGKGDPPGWAETLAQIEAQTKHMAAGLRREAAERRTAGRDPATIRARRECWHRLAELWTRFGGGFDPTRDRGAVNAMARVVASCIIGGSETPALRQKVRQMVNLDLDAWQSYAADMEAKISFARVI